MKIDLTNFKMTTEVQRLLPVRQESLYFISQNSIALKQNTTWEEVTFVGYNAETRKLEAVVQLKQAFGYSGGLCTNGSTEYVRFFIDRGAGFEDAGLSGFKAHDISNVPVNHHPLHFMVQQNVDDSTHRRLCNFPVLPKVRAILSWNAIPTTDPNQNVNFGNIIDARIQIKPKK